jgi:hypothetical protein
VRFSESELALCTNCEENLDGGLNLVGFLGWQREVWCSIGGGFVRLDRCGGFVGVFRGLCVCEVIGGSFELEFRERRVSRDVFRERWRNERRE